MESDVVASYIARRVSFRGESLESIKEESPAPSSQGPEGQYIRDEEYWLEDGNLILVVQNTAFRLYIGILAKQSSVMHERIFHPRLSGDDGTEAYRTVHLPGSPHDWRHLLRRLLPKGTSAHKTTFDLRDDFHMISALLRLSQEYEIKEVMQYAIAALKAVYRDSYDAWIAYDRSVRGGGYDHHGEAAAILSQAVVAINVARRHNIPSILPIAFYHCSCLGGAIAMGYTHQDGTPEHLAADDVARCINGMQALAAANVESMLFLRDYLPAHRTCKYGGGCKRVWKQQVKENLMKDWRAILGNHTLRGFFQTFPGLSALCDVCKRKAGYMLEGRRKKVWQDLPRMFDIAT